MQDDGNGWMMGFMDLPSGRQRLGEKRGRLGVPPCGRRDSRWMASG